jgi:glycosyltransferase involved in cell wall biosynthesis
MTITAPERPVSERSPSPVRRPRYAMISSEIRRDLQWPIAFFRTLDIVHFYRIAPWNDMRQQDFNQQTIQYTLPFDLFIKLWRAKPDIIQGPEPLSLLMFPFLVTAYIYLLFHPKTKLVTLSLEPIPLEKKYHPLVAPIFRFVLKRWFQRATVIFWLESGSKQNLIANGADPSKLVHLLYGSWGVDPDHFSPDGPSISLESPDPVVLFIGRLSREKGANYLFDAFRKVLDRGHRAHLVVVGDGPKRAELEAQARRLHIIDRITWFGTVKHADLPQYMRVADFLIDPSITTKLWVPQLSSTAWHAMSCGLPVITTLTPCLNEFTPPETGLLVRQRDASSLADAIEYLLRHPDERHKLAEGARRYALERFDARRNVQLAEQTILEWCA